jgi:hypothetical protein
MPARDVRRPSAGSETLHFDPAGSEYRQHTVVALARPPIAASGLTITANTSCHRD